MVIEVEKSDAYNFGQLVYFFEKALAISGICWRKSIWPAGVEAYKKNMFALLGKPGYEDRKAELEERLKINIWLKKGEFVSVCNSPFLLCYSLKFR